MSKDEHCHDECKNKAELVLKATWKGTLGKDAHDLALQGEGHASDRALPVLMLLMVKTMVAKLGVQNALKAIKFALENEVGDLDSEDDKDDDRIESLLKEVLKNVPEGK